MRLLLFIFAFVAITSWIYFTVVASADVIRNRGNLMLIPLFILLPFVGVAIYMMSKERSRDSEIEG